MQENLRILISTGIYPPKIGGPAQYAKNLKEEFERREFGVFVKTFTIEDYLPSGVRHLFYFFKIIPKVLRSDVVIILDTFSVALPTILACKIFGKKSIIRTGGDFLWEQYVERTGKKVLLRNFYLQEKDNFSLKDKIIFNLTGWVLTGASKVVFSTQWQKNIFVGAYGLNETKVSIIENYYGPKEGEFRPKNKVFVASSRDLKLKNRALLEKIFKKIGKNSLEVKLFVGEISFVGLMEELKNCYAVIQISLSEISPNLILDAIRHNKPFICTKEVGIHNKIKDAGIFVDPLNEEEIEKVVINLLDERNYSVALERVRNFNFTHTWSEITEEFLSLI